MDEHSVDLGGENEPQGQSEHGSVPVLVLYFPCAQPEHSAPDHVYPGGHPQSCNVERPVCELCVPTGQGVQALAPVTSL